MRLSPLLLSSLAFAPSLLAQRFPEAEPNNDNTTAQPVLVGTQTDSNLAAGEQDWYSFTVAANTRVRIHTSNTDTRVALLDATGTTYLGIDDDARTSTNGYSSDITLNVAAGSYMVQVVGFTATTSGAYSFEVAELTPVVATAEVEPNDSIATATPTTLSPAGGASRYAGTVGPATLIASDAIPAAPAVAVTDVVAASTTTVITATLPLVASSYVGSSGYHVRMVSGANAGLTRAISGNTATTITTAAWPVANTAGDVFEIIAVGSTAVHPVTTPLTFGQFQPAVSGYGRYYLRYTSGANAGLYRQIIINSVGGITTSTFPTAAAAGDTFQIELCDVDYYQITLAAPTEGLWFQINEGEAPWVYGHRYELYDNAGVLLAPTSSTTLPAYGANNGTASSLTPRSSSARVWPAGTYYLAVRSPTAPFSAASVMPNGLIPTGNYLLEIFNLPMDLGGSVAEAEPNNTVATATPITPGVNGTGNVTNGADTNDIWGPLTINAPSTIVLQVRNGATATPMLDSTLRLLNADGSLALSATTGNILQPNGSSSGNHGRIVVSFYLAPSTYYVEVVSPGTTAAQSGDYELQVSSMIDTPYVAASYATAAANATCGAAPFPTLARQFASETPLLGTTFSRQLTNCAPNWLAIHTIGFSNTLYAGGPITLPLDMTPIGAPGCTLNVDPVVLNAVFTDANGVGEIQTNWPTSTVFRGYVFYEQGIEFDAAANAAGLQFSNWGRIITGERSY